MDEEISMILSAFPGGLSPKEIPWQWWIWVMRKLLHVEAKRGTWQVFFLCFCLCEVHHHSHKCTCYDDGDSTNSVVILRGLVLILLCCEFCRTPRGWDTVPSPFDPYCLWRPDHHTGCPSQGYLPQTLLIWMSLKADRLRGVLGGPTSVGEVCLKGCTPGTGGTVFLLASRGERGN